MEWAKIVLWAGENMPQLIFAVIIGIFLFLFFRWKMKKLKEDIWIQHRLNSLFVDTLNKILSKKKLDATEFVRKAYEISTLWIQDLLEKEEKERNPLSSDELRRLKQYLRMIKSKVSFSLEQAEDFDKIAHKLSSDRQAQKDMDWGTIFISFMAGVILGALLSDKKD